MLGALGLALILLALTVLCLICCLCPCCIHSSRAPAPPLVTFVAIDIDFCAGLSAEIPNLQMHGIIAYQKMVRRLIRKYKCYEVSFDGNRFLIASKKPFSAVQLAMEIQWFMLMHDWGTRKYDLWYQLLDTKLKGNNAGRWLNEEAYYRVWSGLRAKVVVHSGECERYFQKSVRRHRYNGRVVQTLQRIVEMAQGGQTIVTEDSWDLLSPEEIAMIDHMYLGVKAVKGEDNPVGMYTMKTIPGRNVRTLRRPPNDINPRERRFKGGIQKTFKKIAEQKPAPGVNKVALLYAAVLERCYELSSPEDAVDDLLVMAQEWRAQDEQEQDLRDEDYMHVLIEQIGRVVADNRDSSFIRDDDYDNSEIYVNNPVD